MAEVRVVPGAVAKGVAGVGAGWLQRLPQSLQALGTLPLLLVPVPQMLLQLQQLLRFKLKVPLASKHVQQRYQQQ